MAHLSHLQPRPSPSTPSSHELLLGPSKIYLLGSAIREWTTISLQSILGRPSRNERKSTKYASVLQSFFVGLTAWPSMCQPTFQSHLGAYWFAGSLHLGCNLCSKQTHSCYTICCCCAIASSWWVCACILANTSCLTCSFISFYACFIVCVGLIQNMGQPVTLNLPIAFCTNYGDQG